LDSATVLRRKRRFLLPGDSEAAWCSPAAESADLTHYWPVSFLGFGGA
jgi:hypothetical protein